MEKGKDLKGGVQETPKMGLGGGLEKGMEGGGSGGGTVDPHPL